MIPLYAPLVDNMNSGGALAAAGTREGAKEGEPRARGAPGPAAACWHRPREVGPKHMQQYSGHIRVIAYFHAMFKDFYQNWTVGTARKRKRRREEERGGGVWILVWGFPQGVECD